MILREDEIDWGVAPVEVWEPEWHAEALKVMVTEAWAALGAAKRREEGLQAQLGACREELRVARQQVQRRG